MNLILLIDDDPDILKLNRKYLTAKGYQVLTADCGEAAMRVLSETIPDCIVLDVLLPDVLGFDLCGKMRRLCGAPIIFLSCKDNENDKIKGLLAGGDDYMTKPFSMRELEARISAHLRRNSGISFDHDNKIISCRFKYVSMSQTEYNLFLLLYQDKNTLISSAKLHAALNHGEPSENNSVAVYISRLRKKIEVFGDGYSIESVRGSGYGFFEK